MGELLPAPVGGVPPRVRVARPRREQLADNLAAADLELSGEERARLDEVSAPPLIYPHWHQAKTASDRLGAPELTLLSRYDG